MTEEKKEEKTPPRKCPVYEDKELRRMAMSVITGGGFCSDQIPDPAEIPAVFMPMLFMGENFFEDVGLLYEDMGAAGPLAINGMPCFHSMLAVNIEQTQIFRQYVKEYYTQIHGEPPKEIDDEQDQYEEHGREDSEKDERRETSVHDVPESASEDLS